MAALHLLTAKHCVQPAVGETIAWTREASDSLYPWSPKIERGIVARYHYDNGVSKTTHDEKASRFNDLMVIELQGRPSRDWYKWDAIGMFGSFNPVSVSQSGVGYTTVGYGCTNPSGTGGGVRKQFAFRAGSNVGVGPNPAVDKSYALNAPLWQNIIAAPFEQQLRVQFSDTPSRFHTSRRSG